MGWKIKIKKPKIVKDIQRELGNAGDAVANAVKSASPDMKKKIQAKAFALAQDYKDARGGGGGFDDCVTIVAAGLAAYGASLGKDPATCAIGAAVATGAGVPAARLACRQVYP